MATLQARSPDGEQVSVKREALDALRASLKGTLLGQGDPGYEECRTLWNGMIDRRPALIARCLGTADVLGCVRFARAEGIALSIKGGGHNIAGLAALDGGLMLDMSLMRGVRVDPVTRTIHAQAGCLLGDVDRETQLHGLAADLGFVSTTGIAGLTLGGGFGYLTRRFGWTCDTVRSMELVTADGRIVRASAEENADLLWGLRGGGGNFGVVTNFEYEAFPIGPEIVGGGIAWRGEQAREVLDLYRDFAAGAPPELTAVAVLRHAPPAPWISKEAHGKPIAAIFVCCTAPMAEAETMVARLKSFGSPVGDILQRRPYVSQQSLLDATQPKGRRYYWKSEYLPGIEQDLLGKTIEHAGLIRSPHSAILVFPIKGKLNELPEEHSPVGNRDAAAVLNVTASWESQEDDESNISWARTAWEDMRGHSTGGSYINFQTEEEGEDRLRSAYGANYDRLVALKTKWDPDNFFRANKNIPPS